MCVTLWNWSVYSLVAVTGAPPFPSSFQNPQEPLLTWSLPASRPLRTGASWPDLGECHHSGDLIDDSGNGCPSLSAGPPEPIYLPLAACSHLSAHFPWGESRPEHGPRAGRVGLRFVPARDRKEEHLLSRGLAGAKPRLG